MQYTIEEDASPPLKNAKNTLVQKLRSIVLYFGRAINSTMLTALGTISTQQSTPTKYIMQNVHQFLDYSTTHTYAIITFHASDMILAGHINASYIV